MEQLTGFTVANRTVEFDVAPTADVLVTIYRVTPTEPLVGWADASVMKALDMTVAQVQQLHIIEESRDWSRTNSVVLEDNVYNMRFHRVINVADPQDPQDVVNKNYMESVQGGFVQQNQALVQQATQQAGIATTKAGEASASASAAKTSETNAQKWAESAESPDGQGDSDSPTGKTQSSKEWAKIAKTWAEQANILTVNDIPAVNKNINLNRKFFNSVTQIGLDNNATLENIIEAMPNQSTLINNADSSTNLPNIAGLSSGFIYIDKKDSSMAVVKHYGTNKKVLIGIYLSFTEPKFNGWSEESIIVEQVKNNTTGYIKYSDGRMEQWGTFTTKSIEANTSQDVTITFPQPFINNKYREKLTLNSVGTGFARVGYGYSLSSKGTTSIKLRVYAVDATAAACDFSWEMKGWWR